jgi:Ni,Fe-hydrogenase III component G
MTGSILDVDELLTTLDGGGDVARNGGGYWTTVADLDVRAMATLMHEREVRLITLTARPDPDGGYRLIYHWDTGDAVLNIATTVTTESGAPTIADLIPGADWAEREIRDYYDLDFTGRNATPTLMLHPGDPAGLFSRTSELGRDADPASTARTLAESAPAGACEEGEPK